MIYSRSLPVNYVRDVCYLVVQFLVRSVMAKNKNKLVSKISLGRIPRIVLFATIVFGVVLAICVYLVGKNNLAADRSLEQVCSQIQNIYMRSNCLAIVNRDRELCNKTAEDGVLACQAIVDNDPKLCKEVEMAQERKVCVNEVARINDNVASCNFADDKVDCIGSYFAGLYWDQKYDFMDSKYCDFFSEDDKNWCLAMVMQDKSYCGQSLACLSLFPQPISFCDNPEMPKSRGECLRDRAMSQRDPSICELIDDASAKDNCYFNIVGHIDPDTTYCSKISDPELGEICLENAAMKLLNE